MHMYREANNSKIDGDTESKCFLKHKKYINWHIAMIIRESKKYIKQLDLKAKCFSHFETLTPF